MTDWKFIKERTVYDGKYRSIVARTFELPNGFVGDFDVLTLRVSGGATVLALTDDDKVITFQQYRPGPRKVLTELPGGGIENDEAHKDAVARELLEETGYEAELEYIGPYYRDAYIDGRWHMYVGRHAKKVAETAHEETEAGEVVLLSVEEFKEALFAGDMTDTTAGYAGLHRLGLL